jgi:hypothetical protein
MPHFARWSDLGDRELPEVEDAREDGIGFAYAGTSTM